MFPKYSSQSRIRTGLTAAWAHQNVNPQPKTKPWNEINSSRALPGFPITAHHLCLFLIQNSALSTYVQFHGIAHIEVAQFFFFWFIKLLFLLCRHTASTSITSEFFYESIFSLQHTATHCTTLHRIATHCITLQHTATHCNKMQHTATHCNALQHTATHCNVPQCTATHCDTLQHTATHCSMLQRNAERCIHYGYHGKFCG